MILTEGDLDEIGDKVRDTTTELWKQFEKQYMKMLGGILKDLHGLQIQIGRIQASIGQASPVQVSDVQMSIGQGR